MLSMLPVSLFQEIITGRITAREWAEFAAEIGLDAFDISILFVQDRTPRGISQFKSQISSSGLPLAMVATYPDFTVPDKICWERELQKAISDIAVASELEAQYVRITAGQLYPGQPVEVAVEQVCTAFEICAEYARRWGVGLLWENHSKPNAWDRVDFDFDLDRFRILYQRLKNGSVYINYDIANAYLLGCGPELLEECYMDVKSIHINDVASVKPMRFAGIGNGSAPIRQTLEYLANRGFNGLYSIEEASGKGWDGITKAAAITKKLIAEAQMRRNPKR